MSDILSGQLLFAAILAGALYVLISLGLNLVYGTLRLLNIAHGDLVMIGAYVAYWAMTLADVPPILSLVLAAVLCAALGWLLYVTLFRRLLANPQLAKRLESNSLLIFFGLSVIIQNGMALAFTASPRGYQYLTEVHQFAAFSATGNKLLSLGIAATISLFVTLFLRFNLFGLSIRALIDHPQAAAVVGVDVDRVRLVSLCAGFACAGLAGVLISQTQQISPFMGFPFTISAFIVIILGGLGNVMAGIAASFLLGFVEIYGAALAGANLRSVLLYGIFVMALLLRPQGLLGKARTPR
jgi:branched-chain amino acid transport system permease protein